ncbi:MAG: hypothetical protein ACW96S_11595 [Promethearchaeota archaeon]
MASKKAFRKSPLKPINSANLTGLNNSTLAISGNSEDFWAKTGTRISNLSLRDMYLCAGIVLNSLTVGNFFTDLQ